MAEALAAHVAEATGRSGRERPGGRTPLRFFAALARPPLDWGRVETMRAFGAGEARIPLTLPALPDADVIALHVEGEAKRRVLSAALGPGPVEERPARASCGRRRRARVFRCP